MGRAHLISMLFLLTALPAANGQPTPQLCSDNVSAVLRLPKKASFASAEHPISIFSHGFTVENSKFTYDLAQNSWCVMDLRSGQQQCDLPMNSKLAISNDDGQWVGTLVLDDEASDHVAMLYEIPDPDLSDSDPADLHPWKGKGLQKLKIYVDHLQDGSDNWNTDTTAEPYYFDPKDPSDDGWYGSVEVRYISPEMDDKKAVLSGSVGPLFFKRDSSLQVTCDQGLVDLGAQIEISLSGKKKGAILKWLFQHATIE